MWLGMAVVSCYSGVPACTRLPHFVERSISMQQHQRVVKQCTLRHAQTHTNSLQAVGGSQDKLVCLHCSAAMAAP